MNSEIAAPIRYAPSTSLKKLVEHAAYFVPFYRDRWRAANCTTSIKDASDFCSLPIIRKADLLEVPISERISSRHSSSHLHRESTSGSTGQPFTMYFDHVTWLRRRLRFLRALFSCSYYIGKPVMLISSRQLPYMRAARWHYVGLKWDSTRLFDCYEATRPSIVYGPLSSLLGLAEQVTRRGTHRPRLVISTAEQLTASHRRLLHSAFKTPVADFYGSTELGLVAWRNTEESSYQIFRDDFYVEFEPLREQPGLEKLIVTDLHARAMPMIRFDTGDVVRRSQSNGEFIIEFAGRQVDRIRLPSGRVRSPYQFTSELETLAAIEQYQVVQHADWKVDVYVLAKYDESRVLQQAEQIVAKLCNGELAVSAHPWRERNVPSERKFRPVRSEVELENENTIFDL